MNGALGSWLGIGCLVATVPAARARADPVVLRGSSFEVQLDPHCAYTIYCMEYDGYVFVETCQSAQGTVLVMGTQAAQDWAGTCHGGETVLAIRLWVDGTEVPVQVGSIYDGSRFVVRKTAWLQRYGRTIELRAESVFSACGAVETIELETISDDTWVPVCYAWMSSHANALTHYFGTRLDGNSFEGCTDADDDYMTTVTGGVDRLAQYDPTAQRGVITCFAAQCSSDHTMIWDRPTDNKLYWRYNAFTNPVPPGAVWRFRVTRHPFAAPEDAWHDALAQFCCTCDGPLGNMNSDGAVDFDDISPFVAALVSQAGFEARYPACRWLNGDIDGDGTVDFGDINPFVKCLVNGGCP